MDNEQLPIGICATRRNGPSSSRSGSLPAYYQLLFRSLLLHRVVLHDVLSIRQVGRRLERLAVASRQNYAERR